MSEEQNELIKKFTKILDTLPADKKQLLYERLKNAQPDERNMIMMTIVNRYNAARVAEPMQSEEEVLRMVSGSNQRVRQQRDERPGTASAAQQRPSEQRRTQDAFGSSESRDVYGSNRTHETRREEYRESSGRSSAPKKRLKKQYRNALIAIVVLFVLGAVGIAGWLNRDKIGGSVSTDDDNTFVSESVTLPSVTSVTTTDTEQTETEIEATPTPTPEPTPTPVPLSEDAPDLTGLVVVLDPGHQEVTDETTEPAAEWLTTEKARCTSGTTGVVTGTPEYEITLEYGLVVKDYLEQCGATVYITRETNDVNMSNMERARFAVDNAADVFIRLHADAASNSAASGVKVYVADSGSYASSLNAWGEELAQMVATAEGFESNGVMATYLYTGLNYANSIPSFQLCMGYLSNSDDEARLLEDSNKGEVAQAIALFCENFISAN